MTRFFLIVFFCAILGVEHSISANRQHPSSDMVRVGIDAGGVKRVICFSGDKKDTITYNKAGEEIFQDYYISKRDSKKRITEMIVGAKIPGETPLYLIDTILYFKNECRPSIAMCGLFTTPFFSLDKKDWYQDSFTFQHCYYETNSNAPSYSIEINIDKNFSKSKEDLANSVGVTYSKYNYLEFDEMGNWTKSEAISYSGAILQSAEGDQDMISLLLDQCNKYTTFSVDLEQRKDIEEFLINMLMRVCRTTSFVSNREYEYY